MTEQQKAKVLIVDFSRVLLFPVEDNVDSLNKHHETLSKDPTYSLFDHFWLNHRLLDYLEKVSKAMPVYIHNVCRSYRCQTRGNTVYRRQGSKCHRSKAGGAKRYSV
jgi:hypothetical protein